MPTNGSPRQRPSTYYQDKHRAAKAYERYILTKLRAPSRALDTRDEQYAHGDILIGGKTGLEVKYDDKFARTRNVFIEIEEKRDQSVPTFTPSGIFARADVVWYFIGNYHEGYLFRRADLVKASTGRRVVTSEYGTSRGFLLTQAEAGIMSASYQQWSDRRPDGMVFDVDEALREVGWRAFGLRYDDKGHVI